MDYAGKIVLPLYDPISAWQARICIMSIFLHAVPSTGTAFAQVEHTFGDDGQAVCADA